MDIGTKMEKKMEGNIIKIAKGSIIAIIITMILLTIYASLLTYTNIQENTMVATTIGITCISILIGSIISSGNIKKNGLINGAMVGIIYVLYIYLLSSILVGFSLDINSIIMLFASIISGMVGGILGVNK